MLLAYWNATAGNKVKLRMWPIRWRPHDNKHVTGEILRCETEIISNI